MSTEPEDIESKLLYENRLFIGNLDINLPELSLIRLLQKHGNVLSFNMLYHRDGPKRGEPRGYAFATYSSNDECLSAIQHLDGKRALGKNLIVKFAKSTVSGSVPPAALKMGQATSNNSRTVPTPLSREIQIQAIQSKLKRMEHVDAAAATTTSATGTKASLSSASVAASTSRRYEPYKKPAH